MAIISKHVFQEKKLKIFVGSRSQRKKKNLVEIFFLCSLYEEGFKKCNFGPIHKIDQKKLKMEASGLGGSNRPPAAFQARFLGFLCFFKIDFSAPRSARRALKKNVSFSYFYEKFQIFFPKKIYLLQFSSYSSSNPGTSE